jgi:hypothetical protein
MADLPAAAFQHWVHSHEEDHGDVQVYRPADFPLPPARGRRGFELKPDGEVVVYGPGPTDKPEAVTQSWSVAGPNRATVGDRQLEIVSVEADRLTARWSG